MAKVKVGVAWRRDNHNAAHRDDLDVFNHPALQNQAEVFTLAWLGAPIENGLRTGVLGDMDLLVIPGGPHANATQIPVKGSAPRNAPAPAHQDYAQARAQSELDLIEQARTLGMPILALCGGSWRLVENYGGQTVELAALDANGRFLAAGTNDAARARHAGDMKLVKTEFKHGLDVQQGSLVENAMGLTPVKGRPVPSRDISVNSVHWAAVRTAAMGRRADVPDRPHALVPNDALRMSARDPGPLGTSEAVESAHGAPVVGVQWHPEYQLTPTPGQAGQPAVNSNPASRAANLRLIQWMLAAGRAYRAHRAAMALLLATEASRAARPGAKASPATLKTAAEVRWRGAPGHTGPQGVGPKARVIPKHKQDDADPANAMSREESVVRAYLFNIGRRKGNLFLTPVELFNLAEGVPLSRFRDPDTAFTKSMIVRCMNANPWLPKYCKDQDKKTIIAWPA
jgi:gamma-glutamyl-gamma-aminobutyrate hydrolase PuuD